MPSVLFSPKAWLGLGVGFLVAGGWAVLILGPAKHRAGATKTAARLDAATSAAMGDLSNEAERRKFLVYQCAHRGGVYDFDSGVCVEG